MDVEDFWIYLLTPVSFGLYWITSTQRGNEMLNIHLLRRLTDQRLKSLKRSLYGKRSSSYTICECCNEQQILDLPEYNRFTADIASISRIQNERDWEKEKWKTV